MVLICAFFLGAALAALAWRRRGFWRPEPGAPVYGRRLVSLAAEGDRLVGLRVDDTTVELDGFLIKPAIVSYVKRKPFRLLTRPRDSRPISLYFEAGAVWSVFRDGRTMRLDHKLATELAAEVERRRRPVGFRYGFPYAARVSAPYACAFPRGSFAVYDTTA